MLYVIKSQKKKKRQGEKTKTVNNAITDHLIRIEQHGLMQLSALSILIRGNLYKKNEAKHNNILAITS